MTSEYKVIWAPYSSSVAEGLASITLQMNKLAGDGWRPDGPWQAQNMVVYQRLVRGQ